jgi:hypothetical protein
MLEPAVGTQFSQGSQLKVAPVMVACVLVRWNVIA